MDTTKTSPAIPAEVEIIPAAKVTKPRIRKANGTGRELIEYSSSGVTGANLPADAGERLQNAIAKKQRGRATTFHEDKAVAVLEYMIVGDTTEEACRKAKVPLSTWYVWRSVVPGLLEATTQAQELQADSQIDQADKMLREVVLDKENPKMANAELRKVQQIADYRFNLAKCRNFRSYGDKRAQMNINANLDIQDADVSRWFNR
jgi:hypothetical protein